MEAAEACALTLSTQSVTAARWVYPATEMARNIAREMIFPTIDLMAINKTIAMTNEAPETPKARV